MMKIGDVYGRLVVLEVFKGNDKNQYQKIAKVACLCGTIKFVKWNGLRDGLVVSCGCYRLQKITSHGDGKSVGNRCPEYRAWEGLKYRCLNPASPSWKHYGGRGIGVCGRWIDSYEAFLEDMGRRPSKVHSIDRIDNSGNYEPSNCRWATRSQQSINRRPREMYAGKLVKRK